MSQAQISQRLRPFKPQAFGRYTLLLPLSTGGMGEIYLAQLSGSHGFDKLCVIKKILPHLAQDDDFVSRFVDEARILVKLHHGNIAQVLDMGVEDGAPFIALEFIDGKDLRRVLSRMRDRNLTLPLSFVLSVMTRVLDALAYAHRKRGDDDGELNLVHRDVSPQNVLISYEGEVKVIDFGLAKSTMSLARTNPSIVLGKFMYMSPEQAKHKGVDRRSDLYAVGLCLWELIAGKNPFDDVPPGELMARVTNPEIPPLSTIEPLCPSALSEAVQKALNPDPALRFQTAEEFRGKLVTILQGIDPSSGAESTSRFMREAFAAEYMSERKMLSTVKEQARAMLPDDIETHVGGDDDEPPTAPPDLSSLSETFEPDDATPAASRLEALNPEALSFAPTRKTNPAGFAARSKNEVFEKETMPAIVVRLGPDDDSPRLIPARPGPPVPDLEPEPEPETMPPTPGAVRARLLTKSFENESTEAATPAMAEPEALPSIMIDGLPSEPVHTELDLPVQQIPAGPPAPARGRSKERIEVPKKPVVRRPAPVSDKHRAVPKAAAPKPKTSPLPPVQRTDTMIVRNPIADLPPSKALPPMKKKGGSLWAWFVIPGLAATAVAGYIAWDLYSDRLQQEREVEVTPAPIPPPVPAPAPKAAPPPPTETVEALPDEEAAPAEKKKPAPAPAPAPKKGGTPGQVALRGLQSDFARIVDEAEQRKFRLQLNALQDDVTENGDDPAFVAKVQSLHAQVKSVLAKQE